MTQDEFNEKVLEGLEHAARGIEAHNRRIDRLEKWRSLLIGCVVGLLLGPIIGVLL